MSTHITPIWLPTPAQWGSYSILREWFHIPVVLCADWLLVFVYCISPQHVILHVNIFQAHRDMFQLSFNSIVLLHGQLCHTCNTWTVVPHMLYMACCASHVIHGQLCLTLYMASCASHVIHGLLCLTCIHGQLCHTCNTWTVVPHM